MTEPQLRPAAALQLIHDVIQQQAIGVNKVNSNHCGYRVVVKDLADMGQGVWWICYTVFFFFGLLVYNLTRCVDPLRLYRVEAAGSGFRE